MKVDCPWIWYLTDDAQSPVGGYNSYNHDARPSGWLKYRGTYSGLRKEMILFLASIGVMDVRMSWNPSMKISQVQHPWPWWIGKIWGEVSESFLSTLKNNLSTRWQDLSPSFTLINWPVTDNSKQHLILGGGERFLQSNVDQTLLSGIVLSQCNSRTI